MVQIPLLPFHGDSDSHLQASFIQSAPPVASVGGGGDTLGYIPVFFKPLLTSLQPLEKPAGEISGVSEGVFFFSDSSE